MRLSFTIFLLIANCLALGWIYFLERDHSLLDDVPSDYGIPLLIKEANYLEIREEGSGASRRLVKDRQDWFLEEPYAWPANPHAVTRILNQIEFLDVKARFSVKDIEAAGQSLAAYGLENPQLSIRFGSEENETVLFFGSQTEVGKRMYVLSPDKEEVLVVDQDLLSSIAVDVQELRRSTIFNIPVFMVNRLLLEIRDTQTRKVRVVKTEDQWSFETPFIYAADNAEVTALIGKLCSMPVVSFVEIANAEPALLGLSAPRISITLSSDRARQTLLIGNPVDDTESGRTQYYAKLENNNTYFIIEPAILDTLQSAEISLRDRDILNLKVEQITEIEIAKDGETISLQQLEKQTPDEATRWRALKNTSQNTLESVALDKKILEELIAQFTSLRAVSFISDAPSEAELESFQLNTPRKMVTIKGEDEVALRFGKVNEDNFTVPLTIVGKPHVFEVDANVFFETSMDLNYYRSRLLTSIPEDHVLTGVKLVTKEEEPRVLWEINTENKESLAEELKNMEVKEADRIKLILKYANRFLVQAYYEEDFEKGFVLGDQVEPWKYEMIVTYQSSTNENAEEQTYQLYFTERIGARLQIGGFPREKQLFSLTQEFINAIFPYIFERPEVKAE